MPTSSFNEYICNLNVEKQVLNTFAQKQIPNNVTALQVKTIQKRD